jgi:hypothetical protein
MKVQLMAGIDSRGPRHGGGVSGPRHPLGQVGRGAGRAFEVLPRRRVVDRTFAWVSKHRRTTRDYEHLPASHEATIVWAMIAFMTRRLTQPTHLPKHSPTPPEGTRPNSHKAGERPGSVTVSNQDRG